MQELSTCKHCSFQFQIGEEDGHSVEDCRDRLKVENEELRHIVKFLYGLSCLFDVKTQPVKEFLSLIDKKYNLTTEQGEKQ